MEIKACLVKTFVKINNTEDTSKALLTVYKGIKDEVNEIKMEIMNLIDKLHDPNYALHIIT